MNLLKINKLKQELKELEKRYKKTRPLMRGSITYMGTKNKQPYFSLSLKGKTKVIYLGDKRAKIAQKYVDNYKASEELVNEMTLIQMEILKLSRK
jgi:hypothetical protein